MEQGCFYATQLLVNQLLVKSHDITFPCRKAGEKGGHLREKKGAFEPPEEVTGEVDKILRTINTEGRWNLVCYREESLNEALRILRKHGKRMLLQSAIKAEIDERIKNRTQPGRKPSGTVYWFTPRWEAVRALFGKGTADLNDKATQDYLDSIDPNWVGNCKGEL